MAKQVEAVVLDVDGYEVGRYECETVKQAKDRIKLVFRDEWATLSETTHATLRTHKGEVRVNGDCVWDTFYKAGTSC